VDAAPHDLLLDHLCAGMCEIHRMLRPTND
jgi:hypothetical protein